jgi:O-antigen ligase
MMLLIGAAGALYALVCFYSNRFFATEFGVEVGQYGQIPGIYGTQLEANILGSYSGACLIIMLVMYFQRKSREFLWGAAIVFAGLLISLSRAATIATGAALTVTLLYSAWTRLLDRRSFMAVLATFAAVGLLLAPSVIPLYTERFSTLDVSDVTTDDNTRVRVLTLGSAFEDIIEHPFLGTGTASFQLGFDYKEIGYGDIDIGGWIGNTEVRILHDTGLVGLAVFSVFIVVLVSRSWKIARSGRRPELLGLLFAGVVYSISFQATEGTMMSFAWIHIGMIAAGVAVFTKRRPVEEP